MHADKLTEIAALAVESARKHGADAADAVIVEGSSLSAGCRMGKMEDIESSEVRDLGLRVFVGKAQANVSTTDFSIDPLGELAERAVAMAKASPEDPYCGLADPALHATQLPELDLFDDTSVPTEDLQHLALQAENAALETSGISNSLGAGATTGMAGIALVTSDGFSGAYRSSGFSLSCAVVAGEGTGMERDYDYSRVLHFSDLEDAVAIGASAAERTLKRLNPRKVPSQTATVVFDPRVSGGLLSHFSSAISGAAIARGTSFLKDHLNREVFGKPVSIVDDPHRPRGLRSKPFDGEGVANAHRVLVEDGVLQTWLMDSRSARQLGLASTGHASRGTTAPPSPSATNLFMEPGDVTREELIGGIANGFYVTDMIGMGVNAVTGDYSRGAAGFWIENGALTYAVSEVTIAGNLIDMFARITPANDLEFRYGTNAPTLAVEGMTIAGA